jgi:hypothetical protein
MISVSVIGLSVIMVIGLVALVVMLLCRPDKDDDDTRWALHTSRKFAFYIQWRLPLH